ncbi:hypothetical protein ACFLVI_04355 [Chloroflexota bacterium]
MAEYSYEAIEYALSQINDGRVFEKFALDFLSKVFGYEFTPAGGIRDRGIDGLQDTFSPKENERVIYQISIQQDYRPKIIDTLEKLKKNKIKYDQLVYLTNQRIPKIDLLIDSLINKFKRNIRVFDLGWLVNHVNDSEATIRSFSIFIESYLHEFKKPGQSYEVASLDHDPRIYIFLRQQIEAKKNSLKLDQILTDTLIIYALSETDPDKGILFTRDEILSRVKNLVQFDPVMLGNMIDQRLIVLSKKPRRINYHSGDDAYCLPYDERIATQDRNLLDASLYASFLSDTRKMIHESIGGDASIRETLLSLTLGVLHKVFYRQGIEFANFVIEGSSKDAFEKSLPDIISEVVGKSIAIKVSKQDTKNNLLTIIRNLVYAGSSRQKEFLVRLAHTYIMLLLFQCDPKLCTYFGSLASKLRIYIGTSIIIPALSEVYLEPMNRRYTSLLLGAVNAGVKLQINEAILKELIAHFYKIRKIYKEEYEGREEVFSNKISIIYVREIMLRAFFYSRMRGQVDTFKDFLNKFISPTFRNIQDDIVQLLKNDYGIEYVPNSSEGIHLDNEEVARIEQELVKYKSRTGAFGSEKKAHTDAEVILTIHAIRDRDNELGKTGVFGYRTWWLTSDVTTQKAAVAAAGKRYTRTCYMRPDFLYNYISFAPTKGQVDESFHHLFPTLLGVSLSLGLPNKVSKEIRRFLKDHKDTSNTRMKALLRELIDDLKQSPDKLTASFTKRFLGEHIGEGT